MFEAEKIINTVDDFSLPFCQMKLQMLFNVGSENKVKHDMVDVMLKAAFADSSKRTHWTGLVSLMSQDVVRQV